MACILLVMQDGVSTRPRLQSQATVLTLHFCPFYTLTLASYIKSELPFLFCKTGLEMATLRYCCKNKVYKSQGRSKTNTGHKMDGDWYYYS